MVDAPANEGSNVGSRLPWLLIVTAQNVDADVREVFTLLLPSLDMISGLSFHESISFRRAEESDC